MTNETMPQVNPYNLLLEAIARRDKALVLERVAVVDWDQHKASSEFDTVGLVFKLFPIPYSTDNKEFLNDCFHLCVQHGWKPHFDPYINDFCRDRPYRLAFRDFACELKAYPKLVSALCVVHLLKNPIVYDDVLEYLVDENIDQYRFNKKNMLVHAWSQLHLNSHVTLGSLNMTRQFVAASDALARHGTLTLKDSKAILSYMDGIINDPFLKEKLPFQELSHHALTIRPMLEHMIMTHATQEFKKDKSCSFKKM